MFYVNKGKKRLFFKEEKCGLLCEPHRIINKKQNDPNTFFTFVI